MITGQLRSQIDKLMFTRLLDIQETAKEKAASRSKKTMKGAFLFSKKQQHLRWVTSRKGRGVSRWLAYPGPLFGYRSRGLHLE